MNIISFALGCLAMVMMAIGGAVAWWFYRFLLTDWETGRFVPPNWGPWKTE